ncbi:MAG TPA: hypothetical protein VFS43_02310 [Polyangiaceae bacterium]|nr:hypothetical protein [Polyangiaceae bacterium]
MQPDDKLVLGASGRIDIVDSANATQPTAAFLLRLDGDSLDVGFGQSGRVALQRDTSANFFDDDVWWASMDRGSGTLFAHVRHFSMGIEPPPSIVPFHWAIDAAGTPVASHYVDGGEPTDGPYVVSSGDECFAVRRVPASPGGDEASRLEFAECVSDAAFSYTYDAPLDATPGLTVFPFASAGRAAVPRPAGPGKHWFAVARRSSGELGLLRLRHEGGVNLSLDPAFGLGSGVFLVKPDALDASLARVATAVAHDPASGGAYLAGFTRGPLGPDGEQRLPFLIKVLASGQGVDAAFAGGIVRGESGESAWPCLVVDAEGRPIVGGRSAGAPLLQRFTAAGAPDETFGPGGIVPLPFAPDRCALDNEGRLLVAGAFVDAAGVAALRVGRVRLDGGAFGEGAPPADDPAATCAQLDVGEPEGPSTARPMLNRAGTAVTTSPPLATVMAKGLLGAGDVDWLRFYGHTIGSLAPAPKVSVTDSLSPLEVCLYVTDNDAFSCSPPLTPAPDEAPGFRGCCGEGGAAITYTSPGPGQDVDSADLLVRVARPASGGTTCELYHLEGSFVF